MRNTAFFLLLSLSLLTFACKTHKKTSSKKSPSSRTSSSTKPAQDPNKVLVFEVSEFLSPVLEKAQRSKKVVFVSFHAKWCAPCKVMEEEVFTYRPTYLFMNQNFLNYSVDLDTENGKKIADIYEITNLPTVIFMDPKGNVLEKKIGMAMSADLERMGNAAKLKMK